MIPLWVLGTGRHPKVVIDAALSGTKHDILGVLDNNPTTWGTSIGGMRIVGPMTHASLTEHNIQHAVIAVGNSRIRSEIAGWLAGLVQWETIVHATAYIARGVELGEGTVICAGAIVQPDTRIGRHVIVNTSGSIDHDSELDDFVHVGPGAHLAGGVRIGEGAFLGTGAIVIPDRSIGPWTTIGAGAVVTRDIPGHVTAVGIPAKPIP